MADLLQPPRSGMEKLYRESMRMLTDLPAQIPIVGNRVSYLLQPHVLADEFDAHAMEGTSIALSLAARTAKEQGRNMTVFFENGDKKKSPYDQARDTAFRTNVRINEFLNIEIPILTEAGSRESNGGGKKGENDYIAAYAAAQYTAYQQIINTLNTSERNYVKGVFEIMPKINIPSQALHTNTPLSEYPTRAEAIERIGQILSFTAIRDLCSASQIMQEARLDSQSDFMIMRGTMHLGMAPCLNTLTDMKFTESKDLAVDIDSLRPVLQISDLEQIISPILWSRKFWQDFFMAYPVALNTPKILRPGLDMHNHVQAMKKMLRQEPWSSYIHTALDRQEQGVEFTGPTLTTLNQMTF